MAFDLCVFGLHLLVLDNHCREQFVLARLEFAFPLGGAIYVTGIPVKTYAAKGTKCYHFIPRERLMKRAANRPNKVIDTVEKLGGRLLGL